MAASVRAPAVSVLVPTYERRDGVCLAVRSVFAQRYTDWELIVVDDGSTDGTDRALQAFGPRLRYLWQENRGVSAARNAGLQLARGEIVAFLDSDDRWLPDHLETVVAMLEREPEAVLASTSPQYSIAGREPVSAARLVNAVPRIFVACEIGHTSGVAVRRSALVAAGAFDERLIVGEDTELLVRLALRGPVSLLRRKTIQITRGSLKEQGGRQGGYREAWRVSAETLRRLLQDDHELGEYATDVGRYVSALNALIDGDREVARRDLEAACHRWPELATRPAMIVATLENALWSPAERLDVLVAVAESLPDPTSDAALFARTRAIRLAFRLGRVGLAVSLLSEWPLRRLPGFLHRTYPVWVRRARRRWHRGRRHR